MRTRPVTVAETSTFLRSAETAGMTEGERQALVDFLARNPLAGDVIQGTGGVRKVRHAKPGTGKSGGYRSIYYYFDEDAPLYAIYAYGKSQKADLTASEKKAAAAFVEGIKDAIKARRQQRVKG
jgi:hypothetical protein